ncbi:hypothetical protein Gpo141_00009654 [Globisporangium polare]
MPPLVITTSAAVVVFASQGRPLTPPASSFSRSSGQLRSKTIGQNQKNTLPHRARVARSASCSEAEIAPTTASSLRRNSCSSSAGMATARLNISYEDEALCTRSRESAYRLFEDATSSSGDEDAVCSNNSRLLARKALRYRNLLGRVQQADLSDPTFDAADFCGITWRKRTTSEGSNP